jgi:hypothetical protein
MKVLSKSRKTTTLVANHHRYARLYQAIVRRAVQDLAQRKRRDEAGEWLLSPDSDYAFATARISSNGIRRLIVWMTNWASAETPLGTYQGLTDQVFCPRLRVPFGPC